MQSKHRTARAVVGATLAAGVMLAAAGCAQQSGGGGDEEVTLTIWSHAYFPEQNENSLSAIDAAFEEANPGVTIDHVAVPYSTFAAKFRAAIAAGSGPDIVTVYPGVFAAEYEGGLQDIADVITPELAEEVLLLDVSTAPDGALYTVPWTTYGFMIFVNNDLFAQAGIEKLPETWDEWVDSCTALRAAGVQPIASGWKDGYLLDWFYYAFTDWKLSDQELGELSAADLPLNSDAMNDALGWVTELNDAGCFQDGGDGRQVVDFQDQFKQGNAAMVLDVGLPSSLHGYAEALGGEDKIDLFAPPGGPGAAQSGPLIDMGPNAGFGITTWTEHEDVAAKYIQYLLSAEAQQMVWDLDKRIANNANVVMTSDWDVEQKLLDLYLMPENRTTYLAIPSSVMVEMESRASGFIGGTITAEEITDAMETAMEKLRPRLK